MPELHNVLILLAECVLGLPTFILIVWVSQKIFGEHW